LQINNNIVVVGGPDVERKKFKEQYYAYIHFSSLLAQKAHDRGQS